MHLAPAGRGLGGGTSADTGPFDHFAFAAHGYDETVARLTEKAIPFGAVGVPGSTIRQLFLRDPNGVNVELNFRGE